MSCFLVKYNSWDNIYRFLWLFCRFRGVERKRTKRNPKRIWNNTTEIVERRMQGKQIFSRQKRKIPYAETGTLLRKKLHLQRTQKKTKPLPGMTAVFVRAQSYSARMYSLIMQTIFWYAAQKSIFTQRQKWQIQRRFRHPFSTGFSQSWRWILPFWNPLVSLALRERLFAKLPLQSIFISSAGTFLSA